MCKKFPCSKCNGFCGVKDDVCTMCEEYEEVQSVNVSDDTNFQKWKRDLTIFDAVKLIGDYYNCDICPAFEFCVKNTLECHDALRRFFTNPDLK